MGFFDKNWIKFFLIYNIFYKLNTNLVSSKINWIKFFLIYKKIYKLNTNLVSSKPICGSNSKWNLIGTILLFFNFLSGFLGTKCGLPYAFYWPWSFCPRWPIRVDIIQTWQVDTQIKICQCQRCRTIWMSSVHCAQVEPNIFPESCR